MWVHVEGMWQQQGFCSGQISHMVPPRGCLSKRTQHSVSSGIHSTLPSPRKGAHPPGPQLQGGVEGLARGKVARGDKNQITLVALGW